MLFNRVAIFILLYSGIIGYVAYKTYLDNGLGIFNGLFHSTPWPRTAAAGAEAAIINSLDFTIPAMLEQVDLNNFTLTTLALPAITYSGLKDQKKQIHPPNFF